MNPNTQESEHTIITLIAAYDRIAQSAIFRTDGPEADLCEDAIKLASEVESTPYSGCELAEIGAFEALDLPSMLAGLYHALADCHGGQFSESYRALCALSAVYTPSPLGRAEEGAEDYAYRAFCAALGCPQEAQVAG